MLYKYETGQFKIPADVIESMIYGGCNCGKCELKVWCRGCPAVAKGTNGSFYAADPQYWKEIEDKQYKEKI